MQSPKSKPVILCILDGWGHREETEHNAIAAADTPNWDRLRQTYPYGTLEASESFVGLPQGQMGNSEVGHMHIGAGRVIMQELPRIDAAIASGELAAHPALQKMIETLKQSGKACHLMGLLSDGGVHSHQRHIEALAIILGRAGIPVYLHAFLDGRDTPPQSARGYLQQLQQAIAPYPCVQLATLIGRYYAMDRDQRWERVSQAYHALIDGSGTKFGDADDALAASYEAGISDEFITPLIANHYTGMQDGDALIMANFRADRARQLLTALLDPAFTGFSRSRQIAFSQTAGMTAYSDALNAFIPALFAPQEVTESLGEIAAQSGLTQLRLAETEKYAHVTFFMNAGREEPFAGEERILIPSPKVATYDLQPEMSAPAVTDALVSAIESGSYDLIIVNYANTDMVGHSGDIAAASKAVEAVDNALGRVVAALEKAGGAMIISADHGNAECMHDAESGQAHTAHTLNHVPCLLIAPAYKDKPCALRHGSLIDLAPTVLELLGLPIPPVMTGQSLLPR